MSLTTFEAIKLLLFKARVDTAFEFAIGAVLLIAIGSLIIRFIGWA
jgi:hypothetical protein